MREDTINMCECCHKQLAARSLIVDDGPEPSQSERILQLEAEVKRYREALEQADDRPHSSWCNSLERHTAPCNCGADDINSHTRELLSTPTPSTSGILALARAGYKLMTSDDPALCGVMHPLEIALDDAVDALSPEEIKILEE